MHESLSIVDFLIIKKADIEIKKINLIIGSQASGKSLIIKLFYFFRNINKIFIQCIKNNNDKRYLDNKILSNFEERFPRYAWEGGAFNIEYSNTSTSILISGTINKRGKTKLSIDYTSSFFHLFKKNKNIYRKILDEHKDKKERRVIPEARIFRENIISRIPDWDDSYFFSNSLFIPASRTFFSNLQNNVFSFIASNNLNLDIFLKEFGGFYESVKFFHRRSLSEADKSIESINMDIQRIMDDILVGKYLQYDDQDWIRPKGKKGKINLINASSGQQESLPMLLALSVWPKIYVKEIEGSFIFIEEPEAHLFPNAQGHIISIISLLYSNLSTNFFLSSHSPYIISALNNLILAGDLSNDGKLTSEEFTEINGSGVPIDFEHVSAYFICDGHTNSIIDEEYRMIGGEVLDEVSEHFERTMNKLLLCK